MRPILRMFAMVVGAMLPIGHGPAQVSAGHTPDSVLAIDGKPAFPIGFSEAPPVDSLTPDGRDAYVELA